MSVRIVWNFSWVDEHLSFVNYKLNHVMYYKNIHFASQVGNVEHNRLYL